jgi:hypothetical protein
MAIAPGLDWRFGLGLWKSVSATLIVEGAFWIFAIIVYLRSTQARSRSWIPVFWLPVLFLTLAWYGNITAPPPTHLSVIGYTNLTLFSLTVLWAYWVNRLRPARVAA